MEGDVPFGEELAQAGHAGNEVGDKVLALGKIKVGQDLSNQGSIDFIHSQALDLETVLQEQGHQEKDI